MRYAFDQLFAFEAADRFAHRPAADAEGIGQIDFVELGFGLQVAFDNGRFQPFEGAIGEGPAGERRWFEMFHVNSRMAGFISRSRGIREKSV